MRTQFIFSLAILVLFGQLAGAAEMPTVPDGFLIEKVASEPNTQFPMFACFDDRGRLFVAESSGGDLYAELSKLTRKCRVRVLEDRDGDGKFETSRVFAENLVFPMGLVWRDQKLYVADGPELIALEDVDGDGRADKRTVIMNGFGHSDNGGLHGLIFGPDGWLYMTLGQPDGYDFKQADGTRMFGRTGGLVRCRTDGSNPQVICRGFENLVEIAFLADGQIVGTNNWFYTPAGGVRDALVHLLEGALYPRHADQGTTQLISGDPLPPLTVFPAVALSGLTRYRRATFPQEFEGNLFSAQHNARKIGRHILERTGSTFKSRDLDFVTGSDPDFHPADVLEDADGSVLVVNTGGWYVQHCPTGKIRASLAPGGIYRVRAANGAKMNDPWGLSIEWGKLSAAELIGLFADARPNVRENAERELVKLGAAAIEPLAAALKGNISSDACERAGWALAAIRDEAARTPLRDALGSANSQVVALAARALSAREDRQAAADLQKLLRSNNPSVQLAAAEALAHCGSAASLPALEEALTRETDRMLEHAVIHAIYRLAGSAELRQALEHAHPHVQQAALLLLDQPPHRQATAQQVFARLNADDVELRRTAQRVLKNHVEWASEAVKYFQSRLEDARLSTEDEQRLMESVLAFGSRQEVVEWLGRMLGEKDGKITAQRRALLLRIMGQMTRPKAIVSWITPLRDSLGNSELRNEAVRTIGLLRISELDEELSKIAGNAQESGSLRLDALRALVARHPQLDAAIFDFLLNPLVAKADPSARLAAVEILAQAEMTDGQLMQFLSAAAGDALVSPDNLLPLIGRSIRPGTTAAVLDYANQAISRGWKPSEEKLLTLLDPIKPTHMTDVERLLAMLRKQTAAQKERLLALEPLLIGGDVQRGRAVFFGTKVSCVSCHRIGKEGGQVGPDLTKVGAIRSGRDLIESIVVPSSTIAQGFDSFVISTKSKEQLAGVLVEKRGDGVVLRDSSGADHRLQNGDIAKMRREATSIMPDGFDQALATDEFRDLLAFLQNLR